MAITEADICNRALRKIHASDVVLSTFRSDNTKAAKVCAQFYDDARATVLRLSPWSCIMKRILLASNAWAAAYAYDVDDLVYGTQAGGTVSVYKCTTAGTSGATHPTWPATATVSDGSVVWTFQYNILATPATANWTGKTYAFGIPSDYIGKVDTTDEYGVTVEAYVERGVLYTSGAESVVLVYVPDETSPDLWDSLLREVIVTQLASMIAYPVTGSKEMEVALANAAMAMVTSAQTKTKTEHKTGAPPTDWWMPNLFDNRKRT